MKAEYIPPKEDVIMQNESPDDVYIIVSGEVEIVDCETETELVVGTLHSGDMFGEVGALCCRPQSFTFRTKTLSQILRLKTSTLIEAMQSKQEDNIAILKNFLQVCFFNNYQLHLLKEVRCLFPVLLMQHHKKIKDLKIGDLLEENGEEEEDGDMSFNLLTAADTGNAAFLEELLRARLDPDVGDSKGRTPLV